MSIRKHLWLLGPALYLATALVFVGYADAAGGGKGGGAVKGYEQATFKVSLKGTQTVEHAYDHTATDPCDIDISESGGETLRFKSTKAVKMTATKMSGLDHPIFMTGKSSRWHASRSRRRSPAPTTSRPARRPRAAPTTAAARPRVPARTAAPR